MGLVCNRRPGELQDGRVSFVRRPLVRFIVAIDWTFGSLRGELLVLRKNAKRRIALLEEAAGRLPPGEPRCRCGPPLRETTAMCSRDGRDGTGRAGRVASVPISGGSHVRKLRVGAAVDGVGTYLLLRDEQLKTGSIAPHASPARPLYFHRPATAHRTDAPLNSEQSPERNALLLLTRRRGNRTCRCGWHDRPRITPGHTRSGMPRRSDRTPSSHDWLSEGSKQTSSESTRQLRPV
jgi:hypothetical protein